MKKMMGYLDFMFGCVDVMLEESLNEWNEAILFVEEILFITFNSVKVLLENLTPVQFEQKLLIKTIIISQMVFRLLWFFKLQTLNKFLIPFLHFKFYFILRFRFFQNEIYDEGWSI